MDGIQIECIGGINLILDYWKEFDKEYFTAGTKSNYRPFGYMPLFSKRVRFLNDIFQPKNVLDVGCAYGYDVHAWRKLGIKAYGLEVSSFAIQEEKGCENIREYLILGGLETADRLFTENSFDLITCFEVLEHIPFEHINKAFINLVYLIRNKGHIVVSLPTQKCSYDIDITHKILKSHLWWRHMFLGFGFLFSDPIERRLAKILKRDKKEIFVMISQESEF